MTVTRLAGHKAQNTVSPVVKMHVRQEISGVRVPAVRPTLHLVAPR